MAASFVARKQAPRKGDALLSAKNSAAFSPDFDLADLIAAWGKLAKAAKRRIFAEVKKPPTAAQVALYIYSHRNYD